MIVICEYCWSEFERKTAYVNRANKINAPLYCNRVCAGLAKRTNLTLEDKKKIKAEYDREYRKKNWEFRKKQMQAYNSSPAGRAMQKRNREKFRQAHLEYCRTPEYKAYKHEYDKKRCAKKKYGEFWEAAIVLNDIKAVLLPDKYEIKYSNGLLNKSIKRKRLWNSQQKI